MYQAQRYFRALELNKVLEKLSEQANCDDSKQMALSLTPLEDYAQVKALMQKTADAYMLSARYTSPALHKLKNCEAALKKAEKGSNLSLRELLDVSAVLHNIRSVKDWRKRCEGESTSLDVLFELLMPNRELENTIDNAILSEEELADQCQPGAWRSAPQDQSGKTACQRKARRNHQVPDPEQISSGNTGHHA